MTDDKKEHIFLENTIFSMFSSLERGHRPDAGLAPHRPVDDRIYIRFGADLLDLLAGAS